MSHQDFEKYAAQKSMERKISSVYKYFFNKFLQDGFSENKTILDYGCGDGTYFDYFLKYFKKENIYGVEISTERIRNCRKIGFTNVFFVNPLEKLPFGSNFFDFINFDQVIEHIPENEIDFYLQELKRVLKPNGRIIILTPNYPIKRLYDIISAVINVNQHYFFDDPTHVTKYDFSSLRKRLKTNFQESTLYPTGGGLYRFFKKDFLSHKIIGLIKK